MNRNQRKIKAWIEQSESAGDTEATSELKKRLRENNPVNFEKWEARLKRAEVGSDKIYDKVGEKIYEEK